MALITLGLSDIPLPRADAGITMDNIAGLREMFLGIRSLSGKVVSPATAIRASFVLACIRILTEDVSALPLDVFKMTPEGPQKALDHPLHNLLNIAPNPIHTPMEVREHIINNLILHGNFYVLKQGETELDFLYPLDARNVVRRGRELLWDFSDQELQITGTATMDTLWRGTIMSANGIDGRAITMLAREAIGLLIAAEEQGSRLFSQGIQSDVTLSTDSNLEEDEREQLKRNIYDSYQGSRNAFTPLLMEGGLKIARIGLTAQESQYMEARNFQGQEIARIFRIPAVLLGMVGDKSATYASAEQFFQSYTKHTLNPWTVRIEQTIRRDLLGANDRKNMFVRHDFSALLKADTMARYQAYQIGINSRFLSPNDCRAAENLPRVPGLDTYQASTPATSPADGADTLAGRVSALILRREQKALTGGRYKDAELFYAQHGAFVEDLTGADLDSVMNYLEMRKQTVERFSAEATVQALAVLTLLCKKGK